MKRFLAVLVLLIPTTVNACPIVRSSCVQSFEVQSFAAPVVQFSAPVVQTFTAPVCQSFALQAVHVPVFQSVAFQSFAVRERIVREQRLNLNLNLQLQSRNRQVIREKSIIRSRH